MGERAQEETVWHRLGRIDYRYIYAIFIAALLLPTVTPIGFPVKVSELVQGFYDAINGLKPGGAILLNSYVSLEIWDRWRPLIEVVMKTLWSIPPEKGITIVLYQDTLDSSTKMHELLTGDLKPPEWRVLTYGETWCDLGFIGQLDEQGYALMAANFLDVKKSDYSGTPLMTLPVVVQVAARTEPRNTLNARDFDLFIWGTWDCAEPDIMIRQWWAGGTPAYHLPMLYITLENCVPCCTGYFGEDKALRGIAAGVSGATELEQLTGFRGEGTKNTDMLAIGGIMTLLFVGLANVSYFKTEGIRDLKKFVKKTSDRLSNRRERAVKTDTAATQATS